MRACNTVDHIPYERKRRPASLKVLYAHCCCCCYSRASVMEIIWRNNTIHFFDKNRLEILKSNFFPNRLEICDVDFVRIGSPSPAVLLHSALLLCLFYGNTATHPLDGGMCGMLACLVLYALPITENFHHLQVG